MELLIVEKSGWSKSIKTDRAVIRVGSAPSNDVQLQSPKIAAVHIQILHSADTDSSCKVVNLAHEITARVSREIHRLPPFAAVDVRDGDEILFDNYSITFRLPLSANVMQSARRIQAALSFADAVLQPKFATTGVLTIKNAGEHSACQFQVDIEGLSADCFQIDPIPLMYSGAQEEVRIRIFHRILYPPAGLQTIVLKVSAPESYPGEELIIRQGIYVTPVFKQALELFDDLSAAAKLKKQAEAFNSAVEPVRLSQPPPAAINESGKTQLGTEKQADSTPAILPIVASMESFILDPPAQQKPPNFFTQEQAMPIASQPTPDIAKLKVVRAPQEDDEDSTRTPEALPTTTPLEVPSIGSLAKPLDDSTQKQTMPVASRPVPDVSKLKVVHDPSDSDHFWDEK